jgi:histidinol-phosphate phosphatase family protein
MTRAIPTARPLHPPAAVLFDLHGTLIRNTPDNRDPEAVCPMPSALRATTLLRARSVPIGVISNQPQVAEGKLTPDDVRRINTRVEQLLGHFEVWAVCPHGRNSGCTGRKPAPGLVLRAASRLGVPARRCLVIGDSGSAITAARSVGAEAVLVPGPRTREREIDAATGVAAVAIDLFAAVRAALGGRAPDGQLPAPLHGTVPPAGKLPAAGAWKAA